uniref:Uncharacterized protein n=1 Tax=Onchocerca volvulus TaxID=6282 RepID=A0A8R1TUQ5_ONCVO
MSTNLTKSAQPTKEKIRKLLNEVKESNQLVLLTLLEIIVGKLFAVLEILLFYEAARRFSLEVDDVTFYIDPTEMSKKSLYFGLLTTVPHVLHFAADIQESFGVQVLHSNELEFQPAWVGIQVRRCCRSKNGEMKKARSETELNLCCISVKLKIIMEQIASWLCRMLKLREDYNSCYSAQLIDELFRKEEDSQWPKSYICCICVTVYLNVLAPGRPQLSSFIAATGTTVQRCKFNESGEEVTRLFYSPHLFQLLPFSSRDMAFVNGSRLQAVNAVSGVTQMTQMQCQQFTAALILTAIVC